MKLLSMRNVLGLCIFLMGITLRVSAQDSVMEIQLQRPNMFTTDELTNIYIVEDKTAITKYNNLGEKVGYYERLNNGRVTALDASDPLRLLLYYQTYNKIVYLDKVLSLIAEIDLPTLGIANAKAVASSKDGGFWVYDYLQTKLKKYNLQMQLTAESNDLFVELGVAPKFVFMLEKEGLLYAYDTDNGIYVFNRFGVFLNQIPLNISSEKFQILGQQFIYLDKREMINYNMADFQSKIYEIPSDIQVKEARIERDYLYLLSDKSLKMLKL